jgi:hypothetical protein
MEVVCYIKIVDLCFSKWHVNVVLRLYIVKHPTVDKSVT